MEEQSANLAVYVDDRTLVGSVSIPEGSRISDFLNDRIRTKTDFITMKDVTITHNDGKKESSKTVFVNKKSIHMITSLENGSAKGIGVNGGPKHYPFVRKMPVRTTIYLPGYELSGFLYYTEEKEAAISKEERTFLPCTDTQIYDINKEKRWKIEFAALNKDHISCFEQNN